MAWPTEAGAIARVCAQPEQPEPAPKVLRIWGPAFLPQRAAARLLVIHKPEPDRTRLAYMQDMGFIAAFPFGFDALRIYGSGAVANGGAQADPAANLGNYRSSTEPPSLAAFGAMLNVSIDRIGEGNVEGVGVLESDGLGQVRWTSAEATAPGPWIWLPDLATRFLPDGDAEDSGLRVSRNGSTPPAGTREIKLLEDFNGFLGWDNISNAERAAGDDEYRAIFIRNLSLGKVDLTLALGLLGTAKALSAGFGAAGAVTVSFAADSLKDWPASGFAENQDTGEVIYYSSRTDAALTVPAAGRDVYAEVGGGAAGLVGHTLYPIPGLRIGTEAPSSSTGFIQTIANESTAPAAITFVHPYGVADAAAIAYTLQSGQMVGLWIHRKVIAGATARALIRQRITVQAATPQETYTLTLRGRARMADTSLDRYELYRGVDADADLAGTPWETFSSLPHTTAALAVGHTYNFVLRKRNVHNLVSQNVQASSIVIDAGGDEVNYPSAPSSQSLEQAAAGAGRVQAAYDYLQDAEGIRGDTWAVWLTSSGVAPDPDVDPATYEEPIIFSDGMAKLDYMSGTFAHGTTLKAIVRVRRSGTPDVDSQNSSILTISSDAIGPSAPAGSGTFLGQSARQV